MFPRLFWWLICQGIANTNFCSMLKNLTEKDFFSNLSNEELEEFTKKLPLLTFEEKDEFVGKTKEFILEMYENFEGVICQENDTLYSYLDFQIGTSHLLCVLCIDVCVKACIIEDVDLSLFAAILMYNCMPKQVIEKAMH